MDNKRNYGGWIQQVLVLKAQFVMKSEYSSGQRCFYAGEVVSEHGILTFFMSEMNRYITLYGNIVNDIFLSSLLAKAGQNIAEIGSTGMQEPALHVKSAVMGSPWILFTICRNVDANEAEVKEVVL